MHGLPALRDSRSRPNARCHSVVSAPLAPPRRLRLRVPAGADGAVPGRAARVRPPHGRRPRSRNGRAPDRGGPADYFAEGDVLVVNDTMVFPARLVGEKEKTGARVEAFLLRELNAEHMLWDAVVDPARKVRVGNRLDFAEGLSAEVVDNTTSRGRTLRLSSTARPRSSTRSSTASARRRSRRTCGGRSSRPTGSATRRSSRASAAPSSRPTPGCTSRPRSSARSARAARTSRRSRSTRAWGRSSRSRSRTSTSTGWTRSATASRTRPARPSTAR